MFDQPHTQFDFSEVPDGDGVVAKCRDCDYEIIHLHETGHVRTLNPGDIHAAHLVAYIPADGLSLSLGLGGSKEKPAGESAPLKPADTCCHESCKGST